MSILELFKKSKQNTPEYKYDPETEKALIRASICNGEQVAGFKNKKTGDFHEVMLIRNNEDLELFKAKYGLDHVDKEY